MRSTAALKISRPAVFVEDGQPHAVDAELFEIEFMAHFEVVEAAPADPVDQLFTFRRIGCRGGLCDPEIDFAEIFRRIGQRGGLVILLDGAALGDPGAQILLETDHFRQHRRLARAFAGIAADGERTLPEQLEFGRRDLLARQPVEVGDAHFRAFAGRQARQRSAKVIKHLNAVSLKS